MVREIGQMLGGPTGKGPKNVVFTEEQLEKMFKECDMNHDGVLSREEIKKAFHRLGALIPGFRADRGLSLADQNGDGMIDLQKELDNLVKYAFKLGYTVN